MDESTDSGIKFWKVTKSTWEVLDDKAISNGDRKKALVRYLKAALAELVKYRNQPCYIMRITGYMSKLVATDYILKADIHSPELAFLDKSVYLEVGIESYSSPELFENDVTKLIKVLESL